MSWKVTIAWCVYGALCYVAGWFTGNRHVPAPPPCPYSVEEVYSALDGSEVCADTVHKCMEKLKVCEHVLNNHKHK